jgi:hypothetical protein
VDRHPNPVSFRPVIRCTQHAILRQRQRNLSDADIDYVMRYGASYHRTGITFTFLRKRDIDPEDRDQERFTRLEGMVILSSDGVIVTVYRNRQALRRIGRKHKYRRAHHHVNERRRTNRADW